MGLTIEGSEADDDDDDDVDVDEDNEPPDEMLLLVLHGFFAIFDGSISDVDDDS